MLRIPCINYCLFIVLLIMVLNCYPEILKAQDGLEYANYLMSDQDYFRAIGEYKKILYLSNDAAIKNSCLLNITRAYHKSSKFKMSIRYASILLNQPEIDICTNIKANNYIGLNYYNLKVFPMAEDFFQKAASQDTTGFSLFYLALIAIEKGDYRQASDKYKHISLNYQNTDLVKVSSLLSDAVLKGYQTKKKNPLLAVLSSTLIPGSGQIYSSHLYDGLQAFLYVGAFAFTSSMAYKYDKKFNHSYINTAFALSITGLFHVGNIIGAQRTASYYNMRQKQRFSDQIREQVFSIDY